MSARDDDRVWLKLLDTQARQNAQRRVVHVHHEVDELAAMKNLAHELFGDRGMLEFNPDEPGIVYVGAYRRVYPPSVPPHKRLRVLILRGHSHAELQEQAKVISAITNQIMRAGLS